MTTYKNTLKLSDPIERERLAPAAAYGFCKLAAAWGITHREALGLVGLDDSSWHSWTEGSDPGEDALERVGLLLGIYEALHGVFAGPIADLWPARPNKGPLFFGERPVDTMLDGGLPAMLRVRDLLDSASAGH